MRPVSQTNNANKCSEKLLFVTSRDGGKTAGEGWLWGREVVLPGARCVNPKADVSAPD